MKKMFLLYNPVSGKGTFKNRLDFVLKSFQDRGYIVTPYRISSHEKLGDVIKRIDQNYYHLIVAAGGDGTLNSVVAGMLDYNIDLPLGIIPMGTSNDFANHLGIKKRLEHCIETIVRGEHKKVDIGTVNEEKKFINVVSAGNLTSIAHNTNVVFKNNLGKLAYYMNVLGQYPVFEPFKIRIVVDGVEYKEKALLLFVLNSPCAGGFKSLAPKAKIDDGKFDVLVVKDCKLIDKVSLFAKVLKGKHHKADYVLYFQTDNLQIYCDDNVETDIDGEKGPNFPMKIECTNSLKVLC